MNQQEKIDYLFDNHYSEWMNTRRKVEDDLSSKQPMFCICGKLATGLHESYCRRFRQKVNSETVKNLKHLIKTPIPLSALHGRGVEA